MEFASTLKQVRKKLSNSPRKLPDLQIKQGIKLCQDISEINRLLRYATYEENLEDLKPTLTLAQVLLQRLVILLLDLSGKTDQDWLQIKQNLFYIKPILSSHFSHLFNVQKWHFLSLQIIIASKMLKWSPQKVFEFKTEASTSVNFSNDKGRFIIAKKDIKAGEIVLIDSEPLMKIIFDPREGQDFDTFCVYCGQLSICPLPCPQCPDVLFCSLQCLRLARQTFHQYECSMRLYGFLRSVSNPAEKEMSVGRMLPLRLLTNYKGEFPICVRNPTKSGKYLKCADRSNVRLPLPANCKKKWISSSYF